MIIPVLSSRLAFGEVEICLPSSAQAENGPSSTPKEPLIPLEKVSL
jgi:hypothetical protein